MRVLVTGATGFIGRAVIPALVGRGHRVVAAVRSAARARDLLGAEPEVFAITDDDRALVAQLERCDAIVNLAGEPVIGARWTESRRAAIRSSRVDFTARLVRAIAQCANRPRVLVSGSAVGFYGDRGDTLLDEESPPGDDFLASVCVAWENAAHAAERLGARVVLLRTGIVLGREGGALARMLPPFRFAVGGPLGDGRQFVPWIHQHDLVRAIVAAIEDGRIHGPLNGVAPAPVTSNDFARALGAALGRPAVVRVPAFALRAAFGAAASALLASQRATPRRLESLGFSFEFPTIDAALADIVDAPDVTIGRATSASDDADEFVRRGRPTHELRARTVLDAPLAEAFEFFSSARNLGLITPAPVRFRIVGEIPPMQDDARIDYTLRIGPAPIRWRTRITRFEPGRRFVDVQERGPYRFWWHEHSFRADGDRTIMEDRVLYAPPLGILGRLVHPFVIAPALRRIFAYRGDVIRARFSSRGRSFAPAR